ncbi:MAG TPA: hypothetical protein VKT81_19335 [Bryobacteraceae bacterium]|nr:hypothetical protein [Bryobacteraceae bacterium]
MGTIATTPVTPLSVLTAPGGPLATSSGSTLVPQSILNSASPTDLASLSAEATALSEANGLFGLSTPDFFQSIDESATAAAFGLTPSTSAAATSPSLEQLISAYAAPTATSGTTVNTTG